MAVTSIGSVKLGDGRVKTALSVMGRDLSDTLEKLECAVQAGPDILEIRADYFDDLSPEAIKDTLGRLRENAGGIPLIFTLRTKAEGGEKQIDFDSYASILAAAAQSGAADALDVECFFMPDRTRDLIESLQGYPVKVIGSKHDFNSTPSYDDMLGILRTMKDMGSDVVKLAVMPESGRDVLDLLNAGEVYAADKDNPPAILISMGEAGVVSRICGSRFGSTLTFASLADSSAPGQVPLDRLREILKITDPE